MEDLSDTVTILCVFLELPQTMFSEMFIDEGRKEGVGKTGVYLQVRGLEILRHCYTSGMENPNCLFN